MALLAGQSSLMAAATGVLETLSYGVERKRLAWILCSFIGALEKGDS
jgi:hypothetical protein